MRRMQIVLRLVLSALSLAYVGLGVHHLLLYVANIEFIPRLTDPSLYRGLLSLAAAVSWLFCALTSRRLVDPEPSPTRKRWPGLVMLALSIGLQALTWDNPRLATIHGLNASLYSAILYSGARGWSLSLAGGVLSSGMSFFGSGHPFDSVFLLCCVLSGKAAMGTLLIEWRRQYRMADQARWAATEFATANVRLQESLSRSEVINTNRERSRVAREVHDTVGYALTAVLVQLRTLRQVFVKRPEIAEEILREAEGTVRTAIEEVRSEVYALKREQPLQLSWQARWRQLGRSFADTTGTRVQMSIPEDMPPLSEAVGGAVYRVIQEGLTNAIRHGRATIVDVTIRWKPDPGTLLLLVSDNGRGADGMELGVGLKGIRERVEAVQGKAGWRTAPDRGFDLGVDIPVKVNGG